MTNALKVIANLSKTGVDSAMDTAKAAKEYSAYAGD